MRTATDLRIQRAADVATAFAAGWMESVEDADGRSRFIRAAMRRVLVDPFGFTYEETIVGVALAFVWLRHAELVSEGWGEDEDSID